MSLDLVGAEGNLSSRKRTERIAKSILLAASLVTVGSLVILLGRMVLNGIDSMADLDFWTGRYSPLALKTGGAGVADSLFASFFTLLITLVVAVPVGTAAGIYLEEYAKPGRFMDFVNATVSNLAGVPSIVYGLLGLAIFSIQLGLGASYLSAGLTLGVLILPMLIVSTQEALKTVPDVIRQASYGLGASKWQTIRHHVLPYSLPGILTGQILALSRAAGETAPILILGIPIFQTIPEFTLMGSGTPLQLRIYYLASDPRKSAIDLADGAILLLLMVTLLLNLVAILVRQRLSKRIKW